MARKCIKTGGFKVRRFKEIRGLVSAENKGVRGAFCL